MHDEEDTTKECVRQCGIVCRRYTTPFHDVPFESVIAATKIIRMPQWRFHFQDTLAERLEEDIPNCGAFFPFRVSWYGVGKRTFCRETGSNC
jgi:hypothetical protein